MKVEPKAMLKKRICAHCHKPKGVFAFAQAYYHPDCFRKVKHKLELPSAKRPKVEPA